MTHAPPKAASPRDEPFGYVCNRCLRCCHHKIIQLNPYEVARLARNRGLSTTEFRAAHTVDGRGVVLSQTEAGACVFLGPEGCTVHPDRPLVCRLYPLGRHVVIGEEERFSHVEPHPQTEGVYSKDGTIGRFLESQGADPFIEAADDYLRWLDSAFAVLREQSGKASKELAEAGAGGDDRLMDMDAVIAEYCTRTGREEPVEGEDRRRLHLSLLYELINPA
jgi:Fe-S-cluster containining protein